eukprot:165506-Chlamydomonas_euryale.AAC.1
MRAQETLKTFLSNPEHEGFLSRRWFCPANAGLLREHLKHLIYNQMLQSNLEALGQGPIGDDGGGKRGGGGGSGMAAAAEGAAETAGRSSLLELQRRVAEFDTTPHEPYVRYLPPREYAAFRAAIDERLAEEEASTAARRRAAEQRR